MQRPNKDENNFISILYAVGLKPLANWEITLKNGHVRRDKDADIDTCAIEIIGANVNNNYISTPADPQASLNIKMPTLVMQIKHLRKYFAFEVHILDSKKIKRQFRICNFQTTTRLKGNFCSIPMKLEDGWNLVHIDLEDFTRRAFNTDYEEVLR